MHSAVTKQSERWSDPLVFQNIITRLRRSFSKPSMPSMLAASLVGTRCSLGLGWRIGRFLALCCRHCSSLLGRIFFFYYGTTVFVATGLSNSFVTQIILGTVNVVCTFPGFGSLTASVVGSVSSWVVLGCVSVQNH